jgi:lysophosphatidylcholine acyltransferase/lyso-PAF acetyltransferase
MEASHVINPFIHNLHLSWSQKIQIAIMSVTIMPVRFIMGVVCLMSAWLLARIGMIGLKPGDELLPMTGWRRMMKVPVYFAGRAMLFSGGFHWFTIKGKPSTADVAPIIVSAPHTTFFDIGVMMAGGLPTCVARIENKQSPIIGAVLTFMQPIFISRDDPNSRQNVVRDIKARANARGEWPQLTIYPEGTTTNGKTLIAFKPGAFYPGVPVQPIVMRHNNETVRWTWQGPSPLRVLWYTLCQFNNKFEIEFLAPYHPSEAEKKDAILYANNVQKLMAKELDMVTSNHRYEDIQCVNYASKLSLPDDVSLDFATIKRQLGMSFAAMKTVLERFCDATQNPENHLSLESLADYIGLPVSGTFNKIYMKYYGTDLMLNKHYSMTG